MDPYLMGAARFQPEPEQGEAGIAVQYLVMGPGGLAVEADALADVGILCAAQGGVHRARKGERGALTDGEIFPKKSP